MVLLLNISLSNDFQKKNAKKDIIEIMRHELPQACIG